MHQDSHRPDIGWLPGSLTVPLSLVPLRLPSPWSSLLCQSHPEERVTQALQRVRSPGQRWMLLYPGVGQEERGQAGSVG